MICHLCGHRQAAFYAYLLGMVHSPRLQMCPICYSVKGRDKEEFDEPKPQENACPPHKKCGD